MNEMSFGSWPILAPVFIVGFVCGAVWMHARYKYMMDRYTALMKSVQELSQRENNNGRR